MASLPPAYLITSDAEAVDVAARLSARLAETAAERDLGRRLPVAELAELRASGLLGITVPRSHGGPGVSSRTLGTVIRLLSCGDGSVGQIPQNHFFCLDAVRESGSADQLDFFYGLVLQGVRFGNALVNTRQPDGSAGTTTIEPDPDGGYLVTGAKSYATGALSADWVPVAATPSSSTPRSTLASPRARCEPGRCTCADMRAVSPAAGPSRPGTTPS